MNKQAFLEETYNSAFEDELEKIAISPKKVTDALYNSYFKIRGKYTPKAMKKIEKTMFFPGRVEFSGGAYPGQSRLTKSQRVEGLAATKAFKKFLRDKKGKIGIKDLGKANQQFQREYYSKI